MASFRKCPETFMRTCICGTISATRDALFKHAKTCDIEKMPVDELQQWVKRQVCELFERRKTVTAHEHHVMYANQLEPAYHKAGLNPNSSWPDNHPLVISTMAERAGVSQQPSVSQTPSLPPILEALRGDDGKMITEMRTSDGKVNATKMCKSASKMLKKTKQFAHFLEVGEVQDFMISLASELDMEVGVVLKKQGNVPEISDYRYTDSQKSGPAKAEGRPTGLQLIDVVNGGKRAGSWVHPQVAIRLAQWCSVKFSVQTNTILYRYMQGRVTTEESEAVAVALAPSTSTALVLAPSTSTALVLAPGSKQAITITDIVRHQCCSNLYATPAAYLPPNLTYLLSLGMLPCGRTVYGWGMTTDWCQRRTQHLADHPGCQIVMLVDVGRQHPKPIEDEMRIFFRDMETRITRTNNKQIFECFVMEEQAGFFDRFRDFMVGNFPDLINSVFYKGICTPYVNGMPVQTFTLAGSAAAEQAMQAREQAMQARERAVQDVERNVQAREQAVKIMEHMMHTNMQLLQKVNATV